MVTSTLRSTTFFLIARSDFDGCANAWCLGVALRNYMSLIKAAGRDRDVDRAFGIIQRLRENNAS